MKIIICMLICITSKKTCKMSGLKLFNSQYTFIAVASSEQNKSNATGLIYENLNPTEIELAQMHSLRNQIHLCQFDMWGSDLVLEKAFNNLLLFSRNYSHLNFIEILDFINENDGPKVLDLLNLFNVSKEQSIDEIEKSFGKSLVNILLDYVFQELGIGRGHEIGFTKKSLSKPDEQSKVYWLNFEILIPNLIEKIENSSLQYNLSRSESISDSLGKLKSSLDQSVIRLVKNTLQFDLTLQQVMKFLDMPMILSNDAIAHDDRRKFENFLSKNFRRSVNSYSIQHLMENFEFEIVANYQNNEGKNNPFKNK